MSLINSLQGPMTLSLTSSHSSCSSSSSSMNTSGVHPFQFKPLSGPLKTLSNNALEHLLSYNKNSEIANLSACCQGLQGLVVPIFERATLKALEIPQQQKAEMPAEVEAIRRLARNYLKREYPTNQAFDDEFNSPKFRSLPLGEQAARLNMQMKQCKTGGVFQRFVDDSVFAISPGQDFRQLLTLLRYRETPAPADPFYVEDWRSEEHENWSQITDEDWVLIDSAANSSEEQKKVLDEVLKKRYAYDCGESLLPYSVRALMTKLSPKLPRKISLPSLIHIDLRTSLSTFPKGLEESTQLEQIAFSAYILDPTGPKVKIPNQIHSFKALTALRLGAVAMPLPDSFALCHKLKILSILDLESTEIPIQIKSLTQLESLYIGNQLEVIPDWITEFELLKVLQLAGNICVVSERALAYMGRLQSCDWQRLTFEIYQILGKKFDLYRNPVKIIVSYMRRPPPFAGPSRL